MLSDEFCYELLLRTILVEIEYLIQLGKGCSNKITVVLVFL